MPSHRSDQALLVRLLLIVCSRIGCLRLFQTLKAFSKVVAVCGVALLVSSLAAQIPRRISCTRTAPISM